MVKTKQSAVVIRAYSNKKLDYLTKEQNQQLVDWLMGPNTYGQIVVMLREKYEISATQRQVSNFFHDHVVGTMIQLRRQAVASALGYNEEVERAPAGFTRATFDALEQRAMRACFDTNTNLKDLKVFLEVLLRWQEQKIRLEQIQLKLRRIEMLEKKQKKLEDVFNSKLSSEEIAERCRSIFKQNGSVTIPPRRAKAEALIEADRRANGFPS